MSTRIGHTAQEIRALVDDYLSTPYGTKDEWLREHNISRWTIGRWKDAVFHGDLERGLIPRQAGPMSVDKWKQARAQTRLETEVARLQARIRELEGTNEALGKAIGLLHDQAARQEPTEEG